MESKYYTPTIEEFHVGFEYEEYQFLERNWKTVKCEFIKPNTTIDPKWFRVKYLDQEDIESLGWEPSFDEPEEWFHNYKGNEEFQLYYDDKTKISSYDGIGITIYMESTIIFNGYIKNKSELKKLMKQLGIYE